jgi:transcriptional regulator with XRE-family HTH domain/tetratricopeptide (TPR) repeat protein
LADLLRACRRSAGLTQATLAEKAGLSEQAISALERGNRLRPRRDTIEALSSALGLDQDGTDQLHRAARRASRRTSGAEAALPAVPRQLPLAVADFTGRGDELDRVVGALSAAPGTPGTAPMIAISGMGGMGKTTLAVRAAHLVPQNFPDGHLYLDLRGYGPGDPMQPLEALSHLLRSLGLHSSAIPDEVDDAAALLRSRLARQRLLLLLDNANSPHQVAPLLPGTSGPAVIVTSRRVLTTLPGFVYVALAPLSDPDAADLLSKIAGTARVTAGSEAARTVTRLIGNLPLAVRLIGARLAARPTWPVEHLVEQLRDERRRLDLLGTDESGVRASIAGSVEFLTASSSEVDRDAGAAIDYLGLPNSSEFITLTAARLLDRSEQEVEPFLERLVDLNLLAAPAPGRYRVHDLVLTFARERGLAHLPEDVRIAALDRLLQLYVDIAWSCQRLTHHHSRRLALAGSADAVPVPFPDAQAALDWLDGQQANLIEAFQQARSLPALRGRLPELALALFGYHEARSRWSQMRTIISAAQEVATEPRHRMFAAWLEHDRAIPDIEQNDLTAGETRLLRALALFEGLGDLVGQARSCSSISYVCSMQNRLDECLTWTDRTLELSRAIGDTNVEGLALLIRGTAYTKQGRHVQAKESFERSIDFAEAKLNRRSLAKRHDMIGHALLAARRFDDAAAALHRSLEIFAEFGDENSRSGGLLRLAVLELTRDDHAAAARHAAAGLVHARRGGDRHRESELLIVTGKIEQARGRLDDARAHWEQAAALLHAYAPHAEHEALDLLAAGD